MCQTEYWAQEKLEVAKVNYMKYLYFLYEDDRYWIELDDKGFANRQIILSDGCYHISAFEECLAEGRIGEEDIDAKVTNISHSDFELIWNDILKNHRSDWESAKQKYKINDSITAELAFYYPQGPIFKVGHVFVKYTGNQDVFIHEKRIMKVIGYDETNMWIIAQ